MNDREAVARAMCLGRATSQCAATCLQRFASSNRYGQCPDAVLVWGQDADAAIACLRERWTSEAAVRRAEDAWIVAPFGDRVRPALTAAMRDSE